MWHNIGLTLVVFVATLVIVLLLMVCGEWGIRRGHARTPAHTPARLGCSLVRFLVFVFNGVGGQVS